jgi:TatD DNase family protein
LKEAINIGCWFSINPAMVKSKSGINIINNIPKNRIITETDAPFTGENEKPYMPWDVELVFQGLSKIWNMSIIETKQQIWNNSKELLTL